MMQRIMNRKSSRPTRASFPHELKSFALTLVFYSLKAYNYVRKTFQLSLPHPSTLRHWYQGLNCQPGFTHESFAALSLRVEQALLANQQVICGLVFDEMSIRKHIEFDGKNVSGMLTLEQTLQIVHCL